MTHAYLIGQDLCCPNSSVYLFCEQRETVLPWSVVDSRTWFFCERRYTSDVIDRY